VIYFKQIPWHWKLSISGEVQMLRYDLLREESILVLAPDKPLDAKDFELLKNEIDPYIEQTGQLKGFMICAEGFPGWEDFAAFLSHLQFIRGHHKNIGKVAAVTDSGFLSILPKIASHFVKAEIRHFPFEDRGVAMAWLKGSTEN